MLRSLVLQSVQVIVDRRHLAHQSHPLCRCLVVVHVQLGLQVVDELLQGGCPNTKHNLQGQPTNFFTVTEFKVNILGYLLQVTQLCIASSLLLLSPSRRDIA